MSAKCEVAGSCGTERDSLKRHAWWSAAARLSLAFLAVVLVVSALLVGFAPAADGVADGLVRLRGLIGAAQPSEAADVAREAEIARLRALSGPGAGSSISSDERVHLRGLLEAARSSTREAEIARLRGLSGPGAGSSISSDELVHLRGLLEAARSSTGADCAVC